MATQSYICKGNVNLAIWDKERGQFVPYFPHMLPPYATLASAANAMNRMQKSGKLPFDDSVFAMTIDAINRKY